MFLGTAGSWEAPLGIDISYRLRWLVRSVMGEKKWCEGNGDGRKVVAEERSQELFGLKPGLPTPIRKSLEIFQTLSIVDFHHSAHC
jgi:hypothetical protein